MPTVSRQVARPPSGPTRPPAKTGGVLDRISPIQFDDEDGIKVLLYGRSGSGKTTISGTFPKQILYMVCSGGNKPGELRSIDTAENRKSVKMVTLEKSSELMTVADHVMDSGEYKTVVLDHASGLQDLVLKEILGLEEMPVQKTWGLATQQQYGQCTLQCKELFRKILSLRQHVVILAQEREFNAGDESSQLLMPTVGAGLTPSLTGWLNTAVDYICQTFLREAEDVKRIKQGEVMKEIRTKTGRVEYCLRTAPDPVYTTKFRVPRGKELPDVITDPSFEKLYSLITSE